MKKSVKLLALALVAIMLCTALVACGKKLSGKYEATIAGTGVVLEFKGDKVTYTGKFLGAETGSVEGTYEIKDDEMTLSFGEDNKDAKAYNGTFDFEEGEDYIKIGTFGKFTKVEEK